LKRVKELSLGDYILALTEENDVFIWGIDFKLPTFLTNSPKSIKISAGINHYGLISIENKLYMMGLININIRSKLEGSIRYQ
jgi:hypothetical protein